MAQSDRNNIKKENDENFIILDGVITVALPELIYIVQVEFQGMKHEVKCYVSGKMRTNFIKLEKGDEVRVKISLYDIDKGIIVRRLTSRIPPRVDMQNK